MSESLIGVQDVKNQLIGEAHALAQQIYTLGGNDIENAVVPGILQSMSDGVLSPEEAVKQLRDILSDKQDYH